MQFFPIWFVTFLKFLCNSCTNILYFLFTEFWGDRRTDGWTKANSRSKKTHLNQKEPNCCSQLFIFVQVYHFLAGYYYQKVRFNWEGSAFMRNFDIANNRISRTAIALAEYQPGRSVYQQSTRSVPSFL